MKSVIVSVFMIVVLIHFASSITAQEMPSQELIKDTITYTSSTETHCDDNGKCWTALYSGVRYVEEDNEWKKVEDARSLKGKGFEIVYLEKDKDFNINVIDFNLTSISMHLDFKGNWKDYPEYCTHDLGKNKTKCNFKMKEKWNTINEITGETIEHELEYEQEFEIEEGKTKQKIEFKYAGDVFAKEFKFGGNSTTIQLQEANTENLEDVAIADTADDVASLIKFNILSLPQQGQALPVYYIDDASLNLYMHIAGSVDNDLYLYRIQSHTWTEDENSIDLYSAWNTKTDLDATQTIDNNIGWKMLSVTSKVETEYNDNDLNVTFGLTDPDYLYSEAHSKITSPTDLMFGTLGSARRFASKEYSTTSLRPYLNITYSIHDSIAPTYSKNSTNATGYGVDTEFSLKINDMKNITASGNLTGGNYIFSWHNGIFWTTSDISDDNELYNMTFYGGQSVNESDKICGNACSGGDVTYDSVASCTNNILADSCSGASSCDGTDTVADIWLNGTAFNYGDDINIITQVMCYGTGDEVKIWYYNGNIWTEEFYDASCNYNGATGNYSDVIKITSTNTEQYIRVQVSYNTLSGDDECFTGAYGDNDDILFNVNTGTTLESDANKTSIEYSNIEVDSYSTINNITATIHTSYYNTSGSIENINTNATLYLEIFNGTDWIDEGDFLVNSTGNFSKIITTPSILAAWDDTTNRDIKITASYLDYNSTTKFDTIQWDDIWVEISSEQDMLNDTAVAFDASNCISDNECWVNTTKTTINTNNAEIKWKIYITDTDHNVNISPLYSYLTTDMSWNYPADKTISLIKNFDVSFDLHTSMILDNCTLRDNRSGTITDTVSNTSEMINNNINIIAETFTIDGHYNISIKCYDTSSNFAETSGRTIIVDTTPPQITIINPLNSTIISDHLNVTFNEIVNWSAYSLDGAANVSMGNIISYNTVLSVLDGIHNITVFANDSVGNMNSSTRFWTKDTTNPIITIISPTTETTTNHTPILNVSVDDVSNITYSIDGGCNITLCTSCTSNNTVLSHLTSIEHIIDIYATNTVGLTSSSSVTFIIFDINVATNPSSESTTPDINETINISDEEITEDKIPSLTPRYKMILYSIIGIIILWLLLQISSYIYSAVEKRLWKNKIKRKEFRQYLKKR